METRRWSSTGSSGAVRSQARTVKISPFQRTGTPRGLEAQRSRQ
jgi:hypothetical protein